MKMTFLFAVIIFFAVTENAFSVTCTGATLKEIVDCLNTSLRHVEVDESTKTITIKGISVHVTSLTTSDNTGNVAVGLFHVFGNARNSFVAGSTNTVNGNANVISGGEENEIEQNCTHCAIHGGYRNVARENANYSSINGGTLNQVFQAYSSVSGGEDNWASSSSSSLSGGYFNTTYQSGTSTNYYSNISGGKNNYSMNSYSSVTGGENNITNHNQGTFGANVITGGFQNQVSGESSSSCGGYYNQIGNAKFSVTSGGAENKIVQTSLVISPYTNVQPMSCSISGGANNEIKGSYGNVNYSVITGGKENRILAGSHSTTNVGENNSVIANDPSYSTINISKSATIYARFSTLSGGGAGAVLNHEGTSVCGHQNVSISAPDQCYP